MVRSDASDGGRWAGPRYRLPILIVLGILLFVFAYLGIQKSRNDSLELLRIQGAALISSLTRSADNAIKANSFFDLLVQEKFSDLAGFVMSREQLDFSYEELADFAAAYGVDGIFIFDAELGLVTYGLRGVFLNPDDIIDDYFTELEAFRNDSAGFRDFMTKAGDLPGDVSMYYFERTMNREYIVVIAADALFYSEAKKNIGIGYLVQNIGHELGIVYILFQTPDGIIFSSRNIGPVLKIEKDEFLSQALICDTTCSRQYIFDGREILEMAKAFESDEYGSGVFRLGIALDRYHEIVTGFDRQMIILSLVIFAVLVLYVMYSQGKQKRMYLDRSYRRIQSLAEKVFESMNSGLVVVGPDGTIELANPEFLRTFSVEEGVVLGHKWRDLPFAEVIPIAELLAGRETAAELETMYAGPAGRRYLLVTMARLYRQENQPTGVAAVIYDYTRVRELEEDSRRRERLTELGDLAAGVAHEIRNPLNAISIAAQRLLSEFEPKTNVDEFQEFTRQIKSEANRLNEIVTRFLALTRSKGRQGKTIDFSTLVEETVKLLRLGLERKDITIVSTVPPDITLNGTEDRFKQMLFNLGRNAIEACEAEGGEVTVVLREEGDEVVLSVIDTGPGIPDDLKRRVFSPYVSTKDSGTGLGLSIVHRIVEEHEGRIEIHSPPSGGTEFRVIFKKQS
ncbi:MAG: PAS domain-containing protein [candidate division Zixibacteria bacterium]|nr:PAS domain-containing protein [candidate division Zixibacteria bacterium]